MPDDAGRYWDDPDFYDDANVPSADDGDSFEMHTVDSGAMMRPRAPHATPTRFPAIPVGDGNMSDDDMSDLPPDDDEDAADDEFVTVTVEPITNRRSTPSVGTRAVEAATPAETVPPSAPRPKPNLAPPPLRTPIRSQARPRSRRERRADRPPSVWWSTLRTFITVLAAAVLVSTIFSLWTRPTFFTDEFRAGLERVQATQQEIYLQPSPLPTEARTVRVGIIAGHTGPPLQEDLPEDPGAVCPDGLTERRINEAIAREVVAALRREQYTVDLLEEFDPRLSGYQADVLVSIHSNDCQDYGPAGTGYSVASASSRATTRGQDERLLNCLINQYGATTGLPHHQGVTYDMTEYHTFSEVAVDTPTSIIEIGFMLNDRPLLLNQQPLVAQGIVNGIRCFLRPELYGDG